MTDEIESKVHNHYQRALVQYQGERFVLLTVFYKDYEDERIAQDLSPAFFDLREVYQLMSLTLYTQLENPEINLIKFWIARDNVEPLAIYDAVKTGQSYWCFHEVYKNIKTFFRYDPYATAQVLKKEPDRTATDYVLEALDDILQL